MLYPTGPSLLPLINLGQSKPFEKNRGQTRSLECGLGPQSTCVSILLTPTLRNSQMKNGRLRYKLLSHYDQLDGKLGSVKLYRWLRGGFWFKDCDWGWVRATRYDSVSGWIDYKGPGGGNFRMHRSHTFIDVIEDYTE